MGARLTIFLLLISLFPLGCANAGSTSDEHVFQSKSDGISTDSGIFVITQQETVSTIELTLDSYDLNESFIQSTVIGNASAMVELELIPHHSNIMVIIQLKDAVINLCNKSFDNWGTGDSPNFRLIALISLRTCDILVSGHMEIEDVNSNQSTTELIIQHRRDPITFGNDSIDEGIHILELMDYQARMFNSSEHMNDSAMSFFSNEQLIHYSRYNGDTIIVIEEDRNIVRTYNFNWDQEYIEDVIVDADKLIILIHVPSRSLPIQTDAYISLRVIDLLSNESTHFEIANNSKGFDEVKIIRTPTINQTGLLLLNTNEGNTLLLMDNNWNVLHHSTTETGEILKIGTTIRDYIIQTTDNNHTALNIESVNLDEDNDGIEVPFDLCPKQLSFNNNDIDSDGIGDICDIDIDGDGILNSDDYCSNGVANWISEQDTDRDDDGCKDLDEDIDDDNDGVLDEADLCHYSKVEYDNDHDGDGCWTKEDWDLDNDVIINIDDSCPIGITNWTSSIESDWDWDGCFDESEDFDDDNDGILDTDDLCPRSPMNRLNWTDKDNDGCADDLSLEQANQTSDNSMDDNAISNKGTEQTPNHSKAEGSPHADEMEQSTDNHFKSASVFVIATVILLIVILKRS